MCLLNCAGANDHLHNSETRLRSPFDRSNFVCLSSTLRISGFHNNWMENRCRVALKGCGLRDLQRKQKWSEGALSIIFVEISGHELRAVWRRSKLKNKVWYSSHYRHIVLLKRAHKQVEIRYGVTYPNNTHTLWKNSCSFSRDFGTRWTSPPFYKFFPSLMVLRCYGTQRFCLTNSTFPHDHQNQLDKPSMMYCVTWSYNFSLVYDLFSDHNTCLFVHNDVFTTYTIIFSANRVTKITQNDKSRDHFHIRIAGIN